MASSTELEHRVAELNGKYQGHLAQLRQLSREPVVVDMPGCGAVHVDGAGRLLAIRLTENARMLSEQALAAHVVAAVREAERQAGERISAARRSYVDSVR